MGINVGHRRFRLRFLVFPILTREHKQPGYSQNTNSQAIDLKLDETEHIFSAEP